MEQYKIDNSPLYEHFMKCGGDPNACRHCTKWIKERNDTLQWSATFEFVKHYVAGSKSWSMALSMEKTLLIDTFSRNSRFYKLPLEIMRRISKEASDLNTTMLPWVEVNEKVVDWTDFDSSNIRFCDEKVCMEPTIADPMIGVPKGYVFGC